MTHLRPSAAPTILPYCGTVPVVASDAVVAPGKLYVAKALACVAPVEKGRDR